VPFRPAEQTKSDVGQYSNGRRQEVIRADYVVLATGSRPDFGGQALGPTFVNIDQLLRLSYLPKRLLIIGGSYMGCEIAQALQSSEIDTHYGCPAQRLLAETKARLFENSKTRNVSEISICRR
jgi:pyruvate/2-oxoglutarate dehydrogenase complex dihydrolipoamide dehydrogenase (E3) component